MSVGSSPDLYNILNTILQDTAPHSMSELYSISFTDGTSSVSSGTISLLSFQNKTINTGGSGGGGSGGGSDVLLVSKGLTGSQGYTMNTIVPNKDMTQTNGRSISSGYNPSSGTLTPSGNRYYWNDWNGDWFDGWGDFYIYNPSTNSATYISFASMNGPNETVYTETQTHHSKTFTIKHGWVAQGIFKLDVECSDTSFEFSIGAYGNMGSDSSTQNTDIQYTASWGTLSYNYNSQSGTNEWFYSHCIPKVKAFNDGITLSSGNFTSNFKTNVLGNDNLALWTEPLTVGATFYFVKGSNSSSGAMYDWVANDIEISGGQTLTPLNIGITGLTGWYEANSFNTSTQTWVDLSGNGNDASTTRGTVYKNETGLNGLPIIYGGTGDGGIEFPSAAMGGAPTTYTIFTVAKYGSDQNTSGTRERIFNGWNNSNQGNNWLSGFWGGLAGVAYHGTWITETTDIHGYDWVIGTSQHSMYRSNGIDRTKSNAAGVAGPSYFFINSAIESTTWSVAEVILYKGKHLTSAEYTQVEQYLNEKYNLNTNTNTYTYSSGFEWGYYNDNYHSGGYSGAQTWFDTRTPVYTHASPGRSRVTDFTNISTASSGQTSVNGDETYSYLWTGYFKAPITSTYYFNTRSDDNSHMWVGVNALNPRYDNETVDNGGLHGMQTVTSSGVNLTGGEYYDFRMTFGEEGGGDDLQAQWRNNSTSFSYDWSTVAFSNRQISSSSSSSGIIAFHYGTFTSSDYSSAYSTVSDAANAGHVYSNTPSGTYTWGTLGTPSSTSTSTTYTWTPTTTLTGKLLMVAGGGGGGGTIGGGGGAGGVVYSASASISASQKTIVVGNGGTGGQGWDYFPRPGSSGTNTSFTGFTTAIGGGGGSGHGVTSGDGPKSGGSGGGGAQAGTTGASGTAGPPRQGYDGGNSHNGADYAGGGGGAGGIGGTSGGSTGGVGGIGVDYSSEFTTTYGDSGWFASGGGGGVRDGNSRAGGSASIGGGGNGNNLDSGVYTAAQKHTGGGGGGGGFAGGGNFMAGGQGGSGIVLIKY